MSGTQLVTYAANISGPTSMLLKTYPAKKVVRNERPNTPGNWYGSNKPMTGYRQVLDPACVVFAGSMALLKSGNCNTCVGPVGSKFGNVISFSGGSGIRSASTNLSPKYYSNTASYLRSRGQSFQANSNIHKAADIDYLVNNVPVWPTIPQTTEAYPFRVDSSLYAMNTATKCPTSFSVYKPSNAPFATQGAVSSSTRLLKLRTSAEGCCEYSAWEKKQKLKLMIPTPCCKTNTA